MQLSFTKRSALTAAVLGAALATVVGASGGSAAPEAKVIPPNPLKADLAKIAASRSSPAASRTTRATRSFASSRSPRARR